MKMEEAWNAGLVFTKKYKINHRDASLAIDLYHTLFEEQIVADWETPTVIKFYQLDGKSYSNSVQVETQWSPVRRMEMRLAYRWLEAKTQYGDELIMRPLIAQHRFFTNIEYSTKETEHGAKWMFDFTAKWLGKQRLPDTSTNPEGLQLNQYSNDYWIFNAQVSRHFNEHFELYVGGENLGNFFQTNPIISAQDPSSNYFDASMIWGPVFCRMGYVGLRWRIGEHDH
jgi:outer membrane receptor protein involved in Fe transport